MIIQAYPNNFDAASLSSPPKRQSTLPDGLHILGTALMITLLSVIVVASYHRLMALMTPQSQAGFLEYLAEIGSFCFAALMGTLCVIRLKPTKQAKGIAPILSAIAGTFALTVVNIVPVTELSPTLKSVAVLMMVSGTFLSVYCLAHLGRSFSILPQARKLVTTGPYGLVRHPLYMTEAIASIGVITLHFSIISVLTGLALLALQLRRVAYEESVLREAFPDYTEYAARVPRFIPWG